MFTFDLDQELPPMGPGLRVSFPLHSATGTASTATVLFELDPGAELPVHTDSAEELLIVVQGTGEARVGDDVARITKHDVALVPPMAPHGLRNIGDDVLRILGDVDGRIDAVRAVGQRGFESKPRGETRGRDLDAQRLARCQIPDRQAWLLGYAVALERSALNHARLAILLPLPQAGAHGGATEQSQRKKTETAEAHLATIRYSKAFDGGPPFMEWTYAYHRRLASFDPSARDLLATGCLLELGRARKPGRGHGGGIWHQQRSGGCRRRSGQRR